MIIEDLKKGIDAATNPAKNTKGAMPLGNTISMYYKFLVVPLVLLIIAEIITGTINPSSLAPLGAIGTIVLLIIIYALYPILLLIAAGIYHLCGMVIGGFKKGYGNTLTAVTYGIFPMLLAAWLVNLVSTFSAIASLALGFVVALWGVYVLVVALSNQQGVSTTKAFIAWLVPTVIIGIILLLVIGASALALVGAGGINSTLAGPAG